MKTVVKMVEDMVYETFDERGHKVIIDMRDDSKKRSQSPVTLLLSAVGACGAVDIVHMLKKRKKTILAFTTEVEGDRKEEHPKGFTHIHCWYKIVSPDVEEEELQRICTLAIEKYCSVADSLKAKITFSTEIKKY